MKVKSRRGPDQDFSRPSKKGKTDKVHSSHEEWFPEPNGTNKKVGHSSSSSFPATSVGKDRPRKKDHSSSRSSRDSKSGKNKLPVSAEKTKVNGQGSFDEGFLDLGNFDSIGNVKKRKLKEYQDAQTCSTGNPHVHESRISEQEFSDSRKEKKANNSRSEGKERSASKGSGRTDKKVSHTKNHKSRPNPGRSHSQRSLDGMDCFKRDMGSVQASVAATSSSSKVSGSHKTKAGFQEVKGSPVESVSSSPMRILNADKFANSGIMEKNDCHDIAAMDSPRRCSDGEDDHASDRSGTARRDKSFTVAHWSDFQNKGVDHMSEDTKSKPKTTSHCTNGGMMAQDGTHPGTEQIKHQGEDTTDVYNANVSQARKSRMELGLEDNNESCKSGSIAEKVKNTCSPIQLQDQSHLHKDGKVKLQEKSGFKPEQSENIHAGKKDYTGKSESRKKDNHLSRGHDFQEVSIDALCKQEALHAPSQNQLPDGDTERSSKMSLPERTDQEVILGKGKPLPSLPSGGSQIETSSRCPRPVGSHKGNGDMEVDPSKVDDLSKLPKKQLRKADHQNGTQQIGSRNPALNGHKSKELDAPSPIRRDSYIHAANNAVKEAKDLKHLADRLKVFTCYSRFLCFCPP